MRRTPSSTAPAALLAAIFVLAASAATALEAPRPVPVQEGAGGLAALGPWLLLESAPEPGSRLDLGPETPGVLLYEGGLLPAAGPAPRMYTFKAYFTVGPEAARAVPPEPAGPTAAAPKRAPELAAYLGLFEFPYRVYLNGSLLLAKGRNEGSAYNSSIREAQALFLPPDLLRPAGSPNELVVQGYPRFERWGLDAVRLGGAGAVGRAVFLRNLVAIELVKAAFVAAAVIGLYFLALFLAERSRQPKYLLFFVVCVSFCLSYFNVLVHFDANAEARLEALSKAGLVLLSTSTLAFVIVFTGALRRAALPAAAGSSALGLAAAAWILARGDKEAVLRAFGYAMNGIIVPQLLACILILALALVRDRNGYALPLLAAFAFVVWSSLSDVAALNASRVPYAWWAAYGFLAIVVAIFATLALEQARLYHKSLQQTADLVVNQARIERLNAELTLQKDSFYRFVPTQFIELLGKDSAVEIRAGDSSLLRLAILFSDIRRFSALSETMPPGENLEFLNAYLNRMERAIQSSSGFVDKYIGDAIMAIFARGPELGGPGAAPAGDPAKEAAASALRAALAMRRELAEFNRHESARGRPDLEMGIGVNTGEAVLGTVGSERRLDTTVIGDSVNLCSRLENLTKLYRCPVLVSERTVGEVEGPGGFEFRLVDHVGVPGRERPLMVYELLDPEAAEDAAKLESRPLLEEAQSLYFARDFAAARPRFAALAGPGRSDELPAIFESRCAAYLENPPAEGWDGVFRIGTKL